MFSFWFGEFVGIELIQMYDYKGPGIGPHITLFLSPETLPYKVTFIGSRNWLGPGVFEGYHFHLHLTYSTRPPHAQSTFTLLRHPPECQLITVSARTHIWSRHHLLHRLQSHQNHPYQVWARWSLIHSDTEFLSLCRPGNKTGRLLPNHRGGSGFGTRF